MLSLRCVKGTCTVGIMMLVTSAVCGQNYPSRPIRLLTSETGGGTDFASRIVAQGISAALGQPVIVDNRGGGGNISGELVARATPDGYTLLVTGSSFWVGPLFRKATYDPVKEFAPVTMVVNSINILVVHPGVPVKSVKDLVDLAKAKPGELNYGSAAVGSSNHLAAELFKSMAGVNIVHIPYKGSGAAIINLIGGQVQMVFATPASVATHIKSGKLRAIAVTSSKPSTLAPGLPSIGATVPGYDTGGGTAMFAPAGTPVAIINRLNREVVTALNQPEVKEKFFNVGVEVVANAPAELAAKIKSDMVRLNKVIKEAGLRLD